MKGWWWKILGAVIFLYVIIGGLTIPLKSGVTHSHPGSAKGGETLKLSISTYNTHFLSAKK